MEPVTQAWLIKAREDLEAIQGSQLLRCKWIPAFAGMTRHVDLPQGVIPSDVS
jgi:hypothetical protein